MVDVVGWANSAARHSLACSPPTAGQLELGEVPADEVEEDLAKLTEVVRELGVDRGIVGDG